MASRMGWWRRARQYRRPLVAVALLAVAGIGLGLFWRTPDTPGPAATPGPYLGPTPTAATRTEIRSPDGQILTQLGHLVAVEGRTASAMTLTLDTPDHGAMRFAVSPATLFYYAVGLDFLPFTGDAVDLAQRVADARGEASVAYAGVPGAARETLAVLFQSGYDPQALPASTPTYVQGAGDVTVTGSITNATGTLLDLVIEDEHAHLRLDTRGHAPREYAVDWAGTDFQGGDPPDVHPLEDPKAALQAAYESRRLVSIASQGNRVLAVLIIDTTR